MIFETKDDYDKHINPEEYERRKKLVLLGVENSKLRNEKKKRYIEAKSRWNRRREVSDNYGI